MLFHSRLIYLFTSATVAWDFICSARIFVFCYVFVSISFSSVLRYTVSDEVFEISHITTKHLWTLLCPTAMHKLIVHAKWIYGMASVVERVAEFELICINIWCAWICCYTSRYEAFSFLTLNMLKSTRFAGEWRIVCCFMTLTKMYNLLTRDLIIDFVAIIRARGQDVIENEPMVWFFGPCLSSA